ncbi:MAG TPA: translesion DNA synthesis-associated protein ImuA [Casimicrobiaceae bacterium]|nr:translesion DNA synthesis-associated protein ImuA [Casimicrobiaceae bacterium]
MNPALATLLSHPSIWRGGDCAPEPDALPTGFAALDRVLPGGGWPSSALTEILLAREGIGEMRLVLPAVAKLTQSGREVVWIVPPHRPHAPALCAEGVTLHRLALVHCRTSQEALWAFDQALRAPECGAAFAWLRERDERVLRRLAVAAREGRTWGVIWRRPGVAAQSASAPLKLSLDARDGVLEVDVRKRRGGDLGQPVLVDLKQRWCTAPDGSMVVPHASLLPRIAKRSPDVRSSAGRLQADRQADRLHMRRRGVAN